jgi:5-amino-6-(5-phospho-D-ribitylamino)uracil phosphatase
MTLSEFSRRMINGLVSSGLRFTFATSRSPAKALSLVRGLELQLPVICLNGAVTVDPTTGRWLKVEAITPTIVEQLIGIGQLAGTFPFLLGEDDGKDTLMHLASQNPVQEAFLAKRAGEPRLSPVLALRPLQQTLSVTFVGESECLQELRDRLALRYADELELRLMSDIYFAGGATLEISRLGVDKVKCLASLSRALEVSPADVVVFGDHLNDLPMFSFAGTAVAVANAVPEVLAAAHVRCGSNDSDGVARFLGKHLQIEAAAAK